VRSAFLVSFLSFGLLSVVLLSACSSEPEIIKLSGSAQGTTWHISYWDNQNHNKEQIHAALDAELARIDTILSNYRDDSIISQFNNNQDTQGVKANEELIYLVEEARKVHSDSQGCYDLTIQPLFKLWGFSDKSLHIPSPAEISEVMYSVGMEKIQTHENYIQKQLGKVHIDVSSIGQGYSVAKLAQLLDQKNIQNYLVEIGGELQTRGQKPNLKPWKIAIERPLPEATGFQKIITIATPNPTAIMTSGTYRHYYDDAGRRYSHILDARTGSPVTHSTVSVTVIHESPTVADAWSTALLCLGTEEGLKIADTNNLSVLFIDQNKLEIEETSSDLFRNMKGITVE
jgi:thiamine biosynthesis lipoprotein